MDFITKLSLVAGKDAILVICNRLSKIIYFVTTTEGTSAEELTRLFRDNMWKLHELLKSIVLQNQVLRVEQVNKPCIGLTQENSIENSV